MDLSLLRYPTKCTKASPVSIEMLNIHEHPWHTHDELELIYVQQGTLEGRIVLYDYEITSQEFLIVNRNALHTIQGGCNNETYLIHIDLHYFEELIPGISNMIFVVDPKLESKSPYHTSLKQLVEKIIMLYFSSNTDSTDLIMDEAMKMLSLLSNQFTQWHFQDNKLTYTNPYRNKPIQLERLRRIISFIYSHGSERITLENIASQEHLSSYYVSRLFADGMGMPFKQYLTLARVEYAHYLLLATSLSLGDVGLECGFPNRKSFREAFQKYTGMTPQQVRDPHYGTTIDVTPLQQTDLINDKSQEEIEKKLENGFGVHISPLVSSESMVSPVFVDLTEPKLLYELASGGHVLVRNIGDLFQPSATQAFEMLEKFNFQHITVLENDLRSLGQIQGGLNVLIPCLEKMANFHLDLRIIVSGKPEANLKRNLTKLRKAICFDDGLVDFLPADAVHIPSLSQQKNAMIAPALEQIQERKQSLPCLYPDGEHPYLLTRSSLKSSFFYMFFALNHFDHVIAEGPDFLISTEGKALHLLVVNPSGKSVRHAFTINNFSSDYICQEYSIRLEQVSEESMFPSGMNIQLGDVQEHMRARAFPPGMISYIKRTPEHYLYTLTHPEAITYVSFIPCGES